jgi:hypothetical protein
VSRIVKARLVIDETRDWYTPAPRLGKELTHWPNCRLTR